jgi:hypothetical protein
VYDLVASNTSVPTYMTDYKEEWREWFDIDKVDDTPVYHVSLVGSLGP